MKKALSLLLSLLLVLTCLPAAAEETRVFTDDLGRVVEIPATIERICPSGNMAQIPLFAICPDTLCGLATDWDAGAEAFIDEKYYTLPVVGNIYGGKGFSMETMLLCDPQLVIDVGEAKGAIVEELDALQEQLGIPFVHIDMSIATGGETYRRLGELLGMEEEAEVLAVYCEQAYEKASSLADSVEKVNLLYCLGDEGLNVIAAGSYHAEIIDMMGNNLAVVENPTSKGTGNEVDLEQLLLWDPELIVFANGSIYDSVADMPLWQEMQAISTGNYIESPLVPYNWMGFPPGAQRYLGLLWLGAALYPDACDYDLYEEVSEFFRLFVHAELTRDAYDALTENAFIR